MAFTCTKCGYQLPEGQSAKFCPRCGGAMAPAYPAPAGYPPPAQDRSQQSGKSGNLLGALQEFFRAHKTPCIAGLGGVGLLIVILIVATIIGGGDKRTVKKLVKAMPQGKGSQIVSMVPGKIMGDIAEEVGASKSEIAEELSERLKDKYEDYDNPKYKINVKKTKNLKNSEVKKVRKVLEYRLENYTDFDWDKVKDIKIVYVNAKFYDGKDRERSEDLEYYSGYSVLYDALTSSSDYEGFVMYKVGMKWYSLDALMMTTSAAYQLS